MASSATLGLTRRSFPYSHPLLVIRPLEESLGHEVSPEAAVTAVTAISVYSTMDGPGARRAIREC